LTLVVIMTIAGILIFFFYINRFRTVTDANRYDHYYVMIAEDAKSSLWQTAYEGAYQAGLKNNSYVDLLNSSFDNNYSKEDLMRIAIASDVDGIIVAADESAEMTDLINKAAAQGIPVITLYSDNTQSERCAFVGIGSYDLGREYGKEVLEIVQEKQNSEVQTTIQPNSENVSSVTIGTPTPVKVTVLVNAYAQDSGQNILCSGIQETIEKEKQDGIEIELSLVSVDDTNTFSAEEAIRDIFMENELPDIIICLNELNTTCVYQAVVDYNKVGQVNILGYYASETIIKAIDRNVIYATISIDTMQMGKFCVDALTEYNTYGNTSQFFIADIALINKENVALYLGGEAEDEE
ncbi:MAG: substrate-binding domain-containing protein, partial [Lachnospiraceae bacterium]|nr:substrate-binding domain-containing protein [Lachnospiraceae bacterium]